MINKKNKIPYKLFFIVVFIVAFLTFLIMNYNPVSITFIFFTVKIPLTILFFILTFLGIISSHIYWKNKYSKLKQKLERTEKLLFKKEELEEKI
ncbi:MULTISPECIES: DUF1049 domain-containing protein [unclassified Gemella]|uniref:DUF1049 domain-containing protein n=1 Tax=unclassified Gemella TaxID=2624949 RepID=UPI001C048DA2|nr:MULTISPECIES: DUF1049 domain-containing protein [unclassified Gemella]MBU0278526.1 DUF1049 domain-containing protein [Gemella sp. zg-1178]QWQ39438.1 DUF1049 domain-containing protein [Gemella sp. zg-570]